jgi:hypothetical protein
LIKRRALIGSLDGGWVYATLKRQKSPGAARRCNSQRRLGTNVPSTGSSTSIDPICTAASPVLVIATSDSQPPPELQRSSAGATPTRASSLPFELPDGPGLGTSGGSGNVGSRSAA